MNRPLAILAMTFLWTTASDAQTTFGAITGVVMDPSGAAVPSVKVTARQVETNAETSAFSNDAGVYTLPQLREGAYEVRASAAGFRPWMAQAIQLSAREIRRLDIKLDVGSVETVVDVTDSVALIETETARLADTKSGSLMSTLPYSGRGAFLFFQLTPNVTRVNGVYVMRFAGSRLNQSDYSMDGVSFMVTSGSNPNAPLVDYTETVEEMRVDVANNTAEFGTVGQVSMISKSGTNELHGSAYGALRNEALNANTFANNFRGDPKPLDRQHNFAFSLGGPVFLPKIYNGKNRSFFYTAYERYRQRNLALGAPSVNAPLPEFYEGDFSRLDQGVDDEGRACEGLALPAMAAIHEHGLALQRVADSAAGTAPLQPARHAAPSAHVHVMF